MNICTCHLLITRPAKHRLSFPLRLPESLITIELSTSLLLSSSSKICASTRIDFRGGGRALSNISPGMHLPPPVHEQAVSPSRFCHSSTGLKMSLIKRAGSGERNTCARVSHPHSESRVGNALWRGMNTSERRERERERDGLGVYPGPFMRYTSCHATDSSVEGRIPSWLGLEISHARAARSVTAALFPVKSAF